MGRGIADLFAALNALLPFEAVVAIGVVGVLVAIPFWIESIRQKQIRGMVRRMVRADEAERARLTGEVFRLAAGRPRRLHSVAQNAIKYDQRRLRDAAIEALRATGRAPDDVRRLVEAIRKPPVKVFDPIQAAIRIERLVEDGLSVAAREHLDAALRAFPSDPDLVALDRRLADPEPAEQTAAGEPGHRHGDRQAQ